MLDDLCQSMLRRRVALMLAGPDVRTPALEDDLAQVFLEGGVGSLPAELGPVAQENCAAALQLRDELRLSLAKAGEGGCLWVHGSTARGGGQVVPNIDFRLLGPPAATALRTRVIRACRDDVDLVLVVPEVRTRLVDTVRSLVARIARAGVNLTVNVVTWGDALAELADPGTPALRRILRYNVPKPLIDPGGLALLVDNAEAGARSLDWPHEADFRTLMTLAGTLSAAGQDVRDFTAAELLAIWPTLHLAASTGLHIGFPRRRVKIVAEGCPPGGRAS